MILKFTMFLAFRNLGTHLRRAVGPSMVMIYKIQAKIIALEL